MRKTIEELKKLNTRNLLAFYKAERNRFYHTAYQCGCGCGEYLWRLYDGYEKLEQEDHENFLASIKAELDTREHVPKKTA